ncbi:hypothetical protein F2Q69_00029212 [Brassica cretica]|uniref:Uncharacterized protein n=1 Tax=Brassica cretica TaxID=69181 RepID=A0A8S9S4Z2_BRACR|nr:hypothetical protein F2Q69_00029212 [Brassica cretica]
MEVSKRSEESECKEVVVGQGSELLKDNVWAWCHQINVDEVEEGEIQKEESLELEEGNNEEDQRQDEREDDFWRMRYWIKN